MLLHHDYVYVKVKWTSLCADQVSRCTSVEYTYTERMSFAVRRATGNSLGVIQCDPSEYSVHSRFQSVRHDGVYTTFDHSRQR